MDGNWFLHVLGSWNINIAFDWILSPCVENVPACHSCFFSPRPFFFLVSFGYSFSSELYNSESGARGGL